MKRLLNRIKCWITGHPSRMVPDLALLGDHADFYFPGRCSRCGHEVFLLSRQWLELSAKYHMAEFIKDMQTKDVRVPRW